MPAMETVAIINKSGKLVSTSKHLVNIFRDAKDAYTTHKAELKAELRNRHEEKAAQKRLEALRLSDRLIEQEPRSRRGSPSQYERPPLTIDNLSQIDGSTSGSRAGSRRGKSLKDGSSRRQRVSHQAPFFEEEDLQHPGLLRRNSEIPYDARSQVSRRAPESRDQFGPPARSYSMPNMAEEKIDMNLAYGDLPGGEYKSYDTALEKEEQAELSGLMTKLDVLMLEAQCVQHSATTIISSLQKNPEAMAAVALTLAELSNLLTKMSPGILSALKAGSPAVFALLASPQFLIAGGLAVGVTVVMFGGYKIIKRIQDNNKREKEEAMKFDEALTYEGDLSTIESWRRGIADVEQRSVATSVDGEFITPEAQRIRKDRIRDRAREERRERKSARSEAGSTTSTVRRKAAPEREPSRTKMADVQTVVSVQSEASEETVKPKKEKKVKERKAIKEKEKKKNNALTVLFGKPSEKRSKSHKQPLMLEM